MAGSVAGGVLLVQASVGLLSLTLATLLGIAELLRPGVDRGRALARVAVAAAVAVVVSGWQLWWIVNRSGLGALDALEPDPTVLGSLANALFRAVLQSTDVSTPWAFDAAIGLTLVVAALVVMGSSGRCATVRGPMSSPCCG